VTPHHLKLDIRQKIKEEFLPKEKYRKVKLYSLCQLLTS
jgi:hypothetical protein